MQACKIRVAATLGFTGVALGAFGAHGLKETLAANGTAAIWETAVFYQMVHTVVLLLLALVWSEARWAFRLFTVGILIFSGTLYLLALTGTKWLGAITPLGGLCLLGGWVLLLAGAGRKSFVSCDR